ncbi:MAG TPA: histidine kinase [Roseiflexaceae bacterium]|nr:histidine kinase [Roseiflexaceae bacterium]
MSGIRQFNHPWLSDHVLFFIYRWSAWLIAVVIGLVQQSLNTETSVLFALSALLNVASTLLAQRYVRASRRNPVLLVVDMLLVIPLLINSGGWLGPFGLYATSSLVLPGLLLGWRGGLMAGFSFVTLSLFGYWLSGWAPEKLWADAALDRLLPTMTVPPLFGALLPWGIERLRGFLADRHRLRNGRAPSVGAQAGRDLPQGTYSRFGATNRSVGQVRKTLAEGTPLLAPTTAVRAAEQSVEDLRRVIFTPLPAAEMDLPAVLDLLAVRFHQHTGTPARVTLLGRARVLHRAQRGVLVRLTQEALLNVQQHAHAATITLTLRYDAASVALLIQDDGVGLLDGTYERPGLHALRAMQYRLAELGGRLDVFETEGGGLTVRAMMPIDP